MRRSMSCLQKVSFVTSTIRLNRNCWLGLQSVSLLMSRAATMCMFCMLTHGIAKSWTATQDLDCFVPLLIWRFTKFMVFSEESFAFPDERTRDGPNRSV